MKHTKKPAQLMCGFLRFHAFLPYSTNLSLAIISALITSLFTPQQLRKVLT